MNQRRTLLIAVLAAAVAAPAAAQTEIKFGHVGEPGSLFQASADEFAKRANAKLGSKAKVVVYGSSQLGGDKELLQKLKLGTRRHGAALDGDVLGGRPVRRLRDALPGQGPRATWQAHREGGLLAASSRPRPRRRASRSSRSGRTATATSPTPSARSTRPTTCKGIKLRVPEGKWRVKMFQTYGANPVADEVLRGVHRAADRRDGRPGEPVHADLQRQVPGSAEVPVADRPRLHARLRDRRRARSGRRCPADVRKILEDTAKETQAFVYETAAEGRRRAARQAQGRRHCR